MRINLTKKDIINSVYMQIGFSKKISENLLEDILNTLIDNLIKNKKVKISNFGTFTVREKKKELVETQKQKKAKLFQVEKSFYLNPLRTLKIF
tara:strand:- start:275 stop:553 length:279 start_codon:yes stop_codon:yes gene_type:complete